MKTKKDLIMIINKYTMINSDIKKLPNGNTCIYGEFSSLKEREDRMTINDLAKEMREGFKQVRQEIAEFKQEVKQEIAEFKQEVKQEIAEFKQEVKQEIAEFKEEVKQEIAEFKQEVNTRLDKIEARLDEHDVIFKRNKLK